MPLNTELMPTAQFTSALGYDYAGHGSKRESDDKKRLLVCLHFITRGSEAMARQLIDHLIKNNDFGYLPPDLGHTPDIAAKIMIADNISSAIALLKGPATGFEQYASAAPAAPHTQQLPPQQAGAQPAGGHQQPTQQPTQQLVVRNHGERRREIGVLWAALSDAEKAAWKTEAEKDFVKGQSFRASEANRQAYQLALMLVTPPAALGKQPLYAVARILGVSADPKRAFARAAALRHEVDAGRRLNWQPDGRNVRSDALSAGVRALIADFWTKSCPAMPGTNDFVRMRRGPKDWIQHQIHSQWAKTRELHADFRSQTGVVVSLGPFQSEKPYYIRRGKQGTCMCGKCENCRHMQSALNNNSQALAGVYGTKQEQALAVLGMLGGSTTTTEYPLTAAVWGPTEFTWKGVHVLGLVSTTTAWYLRRKCLRRPRAGATAVGALVVVAMAGFGFSRVLRGALASTCSSVRSACGRESKINLLDRPLLPTDLCTGLGSKKSDLLRLILCPNAVRDHLRPCFHHCARGSECKQCNKGGRLVRDLYREAEVWGDFAKAPKAVITYRSYLNGSDTNDNELHTHKAHPSVFTTKFVNMLHVYGNHWLTLKKQKAAHLQLERNFMPWQALFDYDFAENFTVIVRNEIQSEYWISLQITLFIGISQHLDMSAWNDLEVTLALSQEVTIVEPGKIPFWAVVAKPTSSYFLGQTVAVRDEKGCVSEHSRCFVHKRRVVSISHVVVSDDKHHDSAFVQVVVPKIKDWLVENGAVHGCGSILEHFIRSDGAGSHFKNKYTMNFLGKYKDSAGLKRAVWCIGCPGHGKGAWDGLAGMIKQWLRQMILDKQLLLKEAIEVSKKSTTRTPVCNNTHSLMQVYRVLKTHFGSSQWREAHASSTISVMNIMYLSEKEITDAEVRKAPFSFDCTSIRAHGRGCRDLFSFRGVRTSCLSSRVFSCWCMPCVLDVVLVAQQAGEDPPLAIQAALPHWKELPKDMQCRNEEKWEPQEIHEITNQGIAANNTKYAAIAKELCERAAVGAVFAVECWDQSGSPHNFFLCELVAFADGKVKKEAPSQVGKSKSTENGEQSQPIRKNDPLFLAQLYVQESTTDDTSQEVVFVKREARVLVNGKGFRYRVQTGELISATRRTTRSSSTAGEFQLQPTACRAIQASLYAQV